MKIWGDESYFAHMPGYTEQMFDSDSESTEVICDDCENDGPMYRLVVPVPETDECSICAKTPLCCAVDFKGALICGDCQRDRFEPCSVNAFYYHPKSIHKN